MAGGKQTDPVANGTDRPAQQATVSTAFPAALGPADRSLVAIAALHLVPATLTTATYVLLAPPLMARGYPALFALLVATIGVLLPFEFGFLMFRAKQVGGTLSPWAVVGLRDAVPRSQYLIWGVGLFAVGILSSMIAAPLERAMSVELFGWLPRWFFAADLVERLASYSPGVLETTFVFGFVVGGFVGPFVEELYFRGYLLPRLARFGRWAPVVSAVLFSAYHFWTPWQNPSRILLMVPLTQLVWRKRNIYLGMVAHIALNAIV